MIVSSKNLCEIFGINQKMLSRWSVAGCPKLGKNKWNPRDVIAWWSENIYEPRLESEEKDESLKNARQRYWKAKAEKEEINVATIKDELIPKKILSDLWCSRVAEVRAGLLNLSDRLPPVLVGRDQPEIREVVHKEVVALLNMYAREGRYTPRPKPMSKSKPKKKIAKRKTKKK